MKYLSIIFLFISIGVYGQLDNNQNLRLTSIKQNKIFPQPINLDTLKNYLLNVYYTSGFETTKCEIDTSGFFGKYGMIDLVQNESFADIVVFTTDQPEIWRADSENEIFYSLKVYSQKVIIWEIIRIGLSVSELNEFLKQHFHYRKGQIVYADLNQYEGIFHLKNDSIYQFEIRTKCDSLFSNSH